MARQYEWQIVAVSGKITLYKGKPEIIVQSPSQIVAKWYPELLPNERLAEPLSVSLRSSDAFHQHMPVGRNFPPHKLSRAHMLPTNKAKEYCSTIRILNGVLIGSFDWLPPSDV